MRRATQGFTLIELIAVLTIIAVVMGVAVTRLDWMVPQYRLRGAAREVGAALKRARARAASTGRDVYLEIDLAKGRYWLLVAFPRQTNESGAAGSSGMEYQPMFQRSIDPDSREEPSIHVVDVVLGPEENVEDGIARVRFSPFGGSDHVIVNLRNDNDEILAVKMNGFTGHVSFYDEYQDAKELLEDPGP